MLVGDSPAASLPSRIDNVSRKSPVDNPRGYNTANTAAILGERRMYGGRISPANRWRPPVYVTRRSFPRGARTSMVRARRSPSSFGPSRSAGNMRIRVEVRDRHIGQVAHTERIITLRSH